MRNNRWPIGILPVALLGAVALAVWRADDLSSAFQRGKEIHNPHVAVTSGQESSMLDWLWRPNRNPLDWPATVDQPYPDLELKDHRGETIRLSSFHGKVVFVELIGTSCAACQAFSGAHQKGSFDGVTPQADLQSIEEYVRQFGEGLSLNDDRIVFVQLLLYDMQLEAPSSEVAARWAQHFGADRSPNHFVLCGTPEMQDSKTFQQIPGFQVIDSNLILRAQTSRQKPRSLYEVVIPTLRRLVNTDST